MLEYDFGLSCVKTNVSAHMGAGVCTQSVVHCVGMLQRANLMNQFYTIKLNLLQISGWNWSLSDEIYL